MDLQQVQEQAGTAMTMAEAKQEAVMLGSLGTMYQIDQAYLRLAVFLMESGGEVDDEVLQAFDAVGMAFEGKVSNYVGMIRMFGDMADRAKAQAARVTNQQKRMERAVERLKSILDESMRLRKLDSLELDGARVSYRKSTAVDILDETLLPRKFLNTKLVVTPDKTAIGNELKAGRKVKGAQLLERRNLQIK